MQAIGPQPQRAPDGAPVHYERHRPEQTTLYRQVQQHAATSGVFGSLAGGAFGRKSAFEFPFPEELESNAISVYMHQLRKKLGADLLHTVRGLGYYAGPETR